MASDKTRSALMLRARRGEFSSASEIAFVGEVTRMTAHRWLVAAGIDLAAERMRRLARLHQIIQERELVRSGQKPLSAQERRRQTLEAVRKFNEAQAERNS